MKPKIERTAEHVSDGHPDKFCDQVADAILDEALKCCGSDPNNRAQVRTAIECLAKDNLLIVSGESRWPDEVGSQLDIPDIAKKVWTSIGYSETGEELTTISHIQAQSPNISDGVDPGGAGDQGIMVGYATAETPEMMPKEWVLAKNICWRLKELRTDNTLPWLRPDTKSQVTLNEDGIPIRFIVAAQHESSDDCGLSLDEIREQIFDHVVSPLLGDSIVKDISKINGVGDFVIGGTTGDAGVVGRKIVVDQFGPSVPVGGGAFSGKDPTKVDRSAAYMARYIAKAVVANEIGGATECTVQIAYGIGQHNPEMVSAITQDGKDVADWVLAHFSDLSPRGIIDQLQLTQPNGWSYLDSAAFGHYGRDCFPWEKVANIS